MGIIDHSLHVDGSGAQSLNLKGGGSLNPSSHETVDNKMHYTYQDGKAVFKVAVSKMADVSVDVMTRNNLSPESNLWLVPHQANKRIIDATAPFAVAFKPNTAFYEAQGVKGWESLEKTIRYIPKDCFIIADAKRGDIGNTSTYYAKTFFETYGFDSVTVAPYMGKDSVAPFLEFKDNSRSPLLFTKIKSGIKNCVFAISSPEPPGFGLSFVMIAIAIFNLSSSIWSLRTIFS